MLVSIKWLEELLGSRIDKNKLPRVAQALGMEIENERRFAPPAVVVGRVLKCEAHPRRADLSVLEVAAGKSLRIVSADRRIKSGDLVLVCPEGAQFNGQTVTVRDFAGIDSQGILISEEELGLTEKSTGVIVLEQGLEGKLFSEVLDDLVVEIKSFPNRPDWLSMIGVARELAIGFNLPFNYQSPVFRISNRTGSFPVIIRDRMGCPRYTARIFDNVRVVESPFEIKWRLHCMGMKGINNIVDATNLMMLLTGQPLHPFDLDRLQGGIIVRRARRDEEFVTLEGTVLKLSPRDVVIADKKQTIALAGIIGGQGSGISETTRRVLLESAGFNPAMIAHTARRLGLKTEASARFEEGVDLSQIDEVSRQTGELFNRLAQARECEFIAAGVREKSRRLTVSVPRLNRALALDLTSRQVKTLLGRAGIRAAGSSLLQITVPSYRRDLQIEEDIFEEAARINGYMNIPLVPQQKWVTPTLPPDKNRRHEELLRGFLIGRGFNETITLSLVAAKRLEELGMIPFVRVKNPLNERFDALRPNLLIGLIDAVNYNIAKGNRDLKLFEIGNALKAEAPFQDKRLTAILGGTDCPRGWRDQDRRLDFFDAKGVLEALFRLLHIDNCVFKPQPTAGFESALAVTMADNEVGWVGKLAAGLVEGGDFYAFEIILDRIWPHVGETYYIPPGKYPANTRDLAFLVGDSVTVPEMLDRIRRIGGPVLDEVVLFDYYTGKNLPPGKRSYGFRLFFRAPDRTLTDPEVDSFIRKIVTEITTVYQAVLRGKEADWTN